MDGQRSILDEVFNNFLKGSRIFKNREVLRHDYIPKNLPHREDHIRYLGEMLAPALRGALCSNVFVYGKTGTGKTAVMKFVLNKLVQKAEELGSSVKVCFANCRLTGTEYRVLTRLCSSIDVMVPFTGLALGEVFDRFKVGLDSRKVLLIVALDEVDAIVKIRGDVLLYDLTRINESLSDSKVMILGISNDLRFKEMLGPRVLSTLSEEELVFRPYNAAELQDILKERSRLAFQMDVLTEGAIKLCAALAAAEHGDARRALDLLRVAGELAERKGDRSISEDHVRRAQKRIEHDRIVETLKSLPSHSKIVMLSVFLLTRFNIKRSMTGDIYNLYCELCGELALTPLTQRRVSGLISELDVIGLLNSRVISLGRYGRTKKTRLGIPLKIATEGFLDDDRLKTLLNYKPRYLVSSFG
ncbi:MAG: orc1/cdc6 family replication initiation protein [Candidatus Bathyarchaeota archaeon]|nr:orc1/cdc6 family replication initiation protein [Candidatus Bathyarchaeota archaeon]